MRLVERDELNGGRVQQLKAGMPLAMAEQRMQEVWWALEAASARQAKPRELHLLEDSYEQARQYYEVVADRGAQPQ